MLGKYSHDVADMKIGCECLKEEVSAEGGNDKYLGKNKE